MHGRRRSRGPWWLVAFLAGGCPATPPSIDSLDGTGADTGSTTVGASTTGSADATSDGSSSSGDDGPVGACGNGIVEGDEACDLGNDNGMGDYCRADCQLNACPDGYLGPGETCDDGNVNNDDGCNNGCGPASCGDGMVQPEFGEACDEGPRNGPNGSCLLSCQNASCGDGFVQRGVEVCDGANVGQASCAELGFGGGVLLCTADCQTFDTSNCGGACGDGMVGPGEDCDGAPPVGIACPDIDPGGDGDVWDRGTLACGIDCKIDDSSCCHDAAGGYCTSDAQCCGDAMQCQSRQCCAANGVACTTDAECCSAFCGDGQCA